MGSPQLAAKARQRPITALVGLPTTQQVANAQRWPPSALYL